MWAREKEGVCVCCSDGGPECAERRERLCSLSRDMREERESRVGAEGGVFLRETERSQSAGVAPLVDGWEACLLTTHSSPRPHQPLGE